MKPAWRVIPADLLERVGAGRVPHEELGYERRPVGVRHDQPPVVRPVGGSFLAITSTWGPRLARFAGDEDVEFAVSATAAGPTWSRSWPKIQVLSEVWSVAGDRARALTQSGHYVDCRQLCIHENGAGGGIDDHDSWAHEKPPSCELDPIATWLA